MWTNIFLLWVWQYNFAEAKVTITNANLPVNLDVCGGK